MDRMKPSTLGVAAVIGTLGLLVGAGCSPLSALVDPGGQVEPGGCHPQLPAAYHTQGDVPVGVLDILVTDAHGVPQASASVMATRMVYTGARCPSQLMDSTGPDGHLHLERMRTGPYVVDLLGSSASASTQVDADRTTSVTLTTP